MNTGDKVHALITIQKMKKNIPTVLLFEGQTYILQPQKVVIK